MMQFSLSDGLTLVAMICAGLFTLGLVAWGLVRYADGRVNTLAAAFAKQLDARDTERAALALELRNQINGGLNALRGDVAAARLKAEEDDQLLHTRLSDARKEFVNVDQHDKDLNRLQGGIDKIVAAIDKLSDSLRHNMRSIEQQTISLSAIQQGVERRQTLVENRLAGMPMPAVPVT